MKLAWMREYRQVVEKLIKYANTYASVAHKEMLLGTEIPFSFAQIQVLEYILENEDLHQNLTTIAARLGISYSTFSKLVTRLTKKGLLQKFHVKGNRKNVVIAPTPKGRLIYEEYAQFIVRSHFQYMFEALDAIPREYLPAIADALEAGTVVRRERAGPDELIPL